MKSEVNTDAILLQILNELKSLNRTLDNRLNAPEESMVPLVCGICCSTHYGIKCDSFQG